METVGCVLHAILSHEISGLLLIRFKRFKTLGHFENHLVFPCNLFLLFPQLSTLLIQLLLGFHRCWYELLLVHVIIHVIFDRPCNNPSFLVNDLLSGHTINGQGVDALELRECSEVLNSDPAKWIRILKVVVEYYGLEILQMV